jgi:general secretion pathway protein J
MRCGCTARRRLGRQAGFTLLEMLVVVGVLGFLMVGLTQGVRTGLALWEAQSRRIGEIAELDAAARILRTLLSGIAPSASPVVTGGGVGAAEIKGTGSSLAFIGDLPTGLGTTQRADITLEVRRGRLVLRWLPHRHEQSNAVAREPSEIELIGRVDQLDVAYWGAVSPEQGPNWRAQWDGPALPELIRLRLVFAKGDRRRFPDLIAATQL